MNMRLTLSCALLYFLVGCNEPNQRAAQYFQSGKLPDSLEQIINPKPAVINSSLVSTPSALSIGVIDCGVDYTHPALSYQIAYDYDQQGNIVGVGKDLMSDDNWAHPNLMEIPKLFAFSAKSINQYNKINASAGVDPLTELVSLNQKFIQLLKQNLANSKELKDTLFPQKIDEHTLTVLGARDLVHGKEDFFNTFNFHKGEKILYPHDFKKLKDKNKYNTRVLYQWNWVMKPDTGVPFLFVNNQVFDLAMFEKSDILYKLISDTYAQINKQYEIDNKINQYLVFAIELDAAEEISERKDNAKVALHEALAFALHGKHVDDSIYSFNLYLCTDFLNDKTYDLLRSPKTTVNERKQITKKIFENMYAFLDVLNKNNYDALSSGIFKYLEAKDRRQVELAYRNESKLHADLQAYLELWMPNGINCDNDWMIKHRVPQAWANEFAHYNNKSKHPYLLAGSNEASHGTHVAGIIASQNDAINIYPIKVTTAGINSLTYDTDQLLNLFYQDFSLWLESPYILEAFNATFKTDNGEKITSQGLVNKFKKLINEDKDFKDTQIFYIEFINQAVKAITLAGQQQLKIANISLGISFERDMEQDDNNISSFFINEYFKYKIAKAMKEQAPNTLFVIASGNDGKWMDGNSRSGIPCDLSTPGLKKMQKTFPSMYVPQNNINNILCVGSISDQNEISSFSNIPMTEVPFVLAYGEKIVSSIKTTDCSASHKAYSTKFAYPGKFLIAREDEGSEYDRNIMEGLSKYLSNSKDWKAPHADAMAEPFIEELRAYIINVIHESRSQHYCLTTSHASGDMSGTSMATPAVAGFIGNWLIQEAKKLGVQPSELYNHPEYSPQNIIAKILAESPTYGDRSILGQIKKVINIKRYRDAIPESLQKQLEQGYWSKRPLAGILMPIM